MNTRERIARAAYAVEQREFGGVDWDYPGDDLEGPADTAAAYEIADAVIAIVREAMLDLDVLYAATAGLSTWARDIHARDKAGRVISAALDAAFHD